MKSIWNVLLAALPVFGMAAALVLADGDRARDTIPQTFYSAVPDRNLPIWVSADLARTPENQIDWTLFPESERAALRRQLANQKRLKAVERPKNLSPLQASGREPVNDDNCITYEKSFFHLTGEVEEKGIVGLVKSARGVYSATVTGISQGFFLGSPASVLELDITETWKTDDGLPPDKLFAVYPFARFAINEGVFCSGLPGSLPQPQIGQRVVAFVSSNPLDRQRTLVWIDPKVFIAEDRDGRVSLPRALQGDPEFFPVRSFDEVQELLRRMLHRAERPSVDPGESGR